MTKAPLFRYRGPLDGARLQEFASIFRKAHKRMPNERRLSAAAILMELTHNIFDYRESAGIDDNCVDLKLSMSREGSCVLSASAKSDVKAYKKVSRSLKNLNKLSKSELDQVITSSSTHEESSARGFGWAVIVQEAKNWRDSGCVNARAFEDANEVFLEIEAKVA